MIVGKTKSQLGLDCNDIELQDENGKTLKILLGGNGNLYWRYNNNILDGYNNFRITKQNMDIYKLFDNLYNDIAQCNIYKMEETDYKLCDSKEEIRTLYQEKEKMNEILKSTKKYKKIFMFNVVSWRSDNMDFNKANVVNIYKEKDEYILMFNFYNKELYGNTIEFDKNNSLYNLFNKLFINMFEELQKYDNQYHQIHLEEIEYEKIKKLKKGA